MKPRISFNERTHKQCISSLLTISIKEIRQKKEIRYKNNLYVKYVSLKDTDALIVIYGNSYQLIRIIDQACHLWGKRYYFECPSTKEKAYKLYFVWGKLLSRKWFDHYYPIQHYSKSLRILSKLPWNIDKICTFRDNITYTTRNGKVTKKYMKLVKALYIEKNTQYQILIKKILDIVWHTLESIFRWMLHSIQQLRVDVHKEYKSKHL